MYRVFVFCVFVSLGLRVFVSSYLPVFVSSCLRSSCGRWQPPASIFYPSSRGRPRRMVCMEFFHKFWSIFPDRQIRFPGSLFVSFPFDQELKSCRSCVPLHIINRIDKIWTFSILDDHWRWFWHLSADWVMSWGLQQANMERRMYLHFYGQFQFISVWAYFSLYRIFSSEFPVELLRGSLRAQVSCVQVDLITFLEVVCG